MPLVDRLAGKWREIREERRLGEESRRRVFESLSAEHKDRACREIAAWLREADSSSNQDDDYYYSQAQQRIAGFRWQLYRLNRPFIWLEKKVIEPLDDWSKRANVFQFFERVSPVIEAIGVLAIPIVIFYFESQREQRQIQFEEQREERQLEFERSLVSSQAEVRKQQAVRDYLSQITTIYLDVEQKENIDEDLRKLLRATTLAVLEELSISEGSQGQKEDGEKTESEGSPRFDRDAVVGDRKGEVIKFLSELGWINGFENDKPLISLRNSNLSQADLKRVDLKGADLSGANLSQADLRESDLKGADLREADLKGVNLTLEADLREADLREANLEGALLGMVHYPLKSINLSDLFLKRDDVREGFVDGADLRGANLKGVNLKGAYLVGANLGEANFYGANFYGANLYEANFYGANLGEANFYGADLAGVNLLGANLDGTVMIGAKFCQTTMPDGSIRNEYCWKYQE